MADNGFEQLRETAESRFPGRVARLEDGAFAIVRDALGRRGRQALHDRAKGVVLVRRRLDAERSGYSADSDGDAREASAADPAGSAQDDKLNADIKNVRLNEMVKGSVIKGLISRMANAVDNEKFDKLVHLNSLSSAADIYEGIVQLHSIIENICNQVNVTQSFVDNGEDLNSVGEAQAFASKTAITALAFAKMGPGFTARLQGLLHGGEIDTLRRVSA